MGKQSAEELIDAAARNPFQKTLYQSHILSLEMYINMFLNTRSIYPA